MSFEKQSLQGRLARNCIFCRRTAVQRRSFDIVHLFFSSSQTKENICSSHHSHGTKYILLKQCVYVHIPQVNRSVKLIYFLLLFLLKCYRGNLDIVNINSKWLPMIKCQMNSKALVFNMYLIILSVLQQILQLQSSTDQLKNTNYNKWDHA